MSPGDRVHPSFTLERSHRIENLQLTLLEFRHAVTGARHLHLASDNRENAFLVAFKTLPVNSRGVAHVLEHTVLCGSERYPVRDPFFYMIRRSLNTYMNAFTSSDLTAYPFASQNRKDFFNLLDVYLDAVFFCKLDPLDFAQEGHRLEFTQPDDPTSPLELRGVVYNEMKGDQSSVVSQLYDTVKRYLYPTTPYHHNSGGDPREIPDLTYEELREFHRTHYHPGNAVFMTYGDIEPLALQERFEIDALGRFGPMEQKILIADERRYERPARVVEAYSLPESEEEIARRTHIVIGWLLGRNTNLEQLLEAHLLSDLLLDTSASPLRRALETTELGQSVSPLCGIEDSNREICFLCGIEGSEPECAEPLEALVEAELNRIAEDGVPVADLEAVLHQLELQQREIGGDGYPYGLQLMFGALSAAMHEGDAAAMLDLEPALAKLRESIRDPGFAGRLVRELLLDNPHRITLTFKPDAELGEQRERELKGRLLAVRDALTQAEKAGIVSLADRLREHQDAIQPEEVLPRVGLEDIDSGLSVPQGDRRLLASGLPASLFGQGTNGLVYLQVVTETPHLEEELLRLLPYYTGLLTEIGSGGRGYLETQRLQQRVTGAVHAFSSFRCDLHDLAISRGFTTVSSKALTGNFAEMSRLLRDTREKVEFDEPKRMAELIAQIRARREANITSAGTQLAMTAAASAFSPVIQLNHRLSGCEGIRYLRALEQETRSERGMRRICDSLREIHHRVTCSPCEFLLITEPQHLEALTEKLDEIWGGIGGSGNAFTPMRLPAPGDRVQQLWTTNTQVNFCARAYPTVPEGHPDAAALIVLGGVLRNGYLHGAVREKGGAYGAGASQDSSNGVFRFSSFSDPNLEETLEHFDRAIDWFRKAGVTFGKVEEAILGVVSSIDAPASPAGEARQAFHNALFGRTAAHREWLRGEILKVREEDLERVVERYLLPERAGTAVLTSVDTARKVGLNGFEVHDL